MNINAKYHRREYYEALLHRLSELTDLSFTNVSLISNAALLLKINYCLIYLELEQYTSEEIVNISEGMAETG